jgi:hypothetical protein
MAVKTKRIAAAVNGIEMVAFAGLHVAAMIIGV